MARDNVKDLLSGQNQTNDRRNKTVNLILSIIIAIFLWGYVIGLVNPETDRAFNDVPLSATGMLELEERGLAVVAMGERDVNVKVTGRRSDIFDISADQIIASLDLAECELGENQVPVRVTLLSGMTDVEAQPEYVSVTVNRIITEERPVQVSVDGQVPEGWELGAISLDMPEMEISGGSSLVALVDHLEAKLTVEEGVTSYSAMLAITPVDEEGNAVEGIALEQEWVSVQASLLATKTVELEVRYEGEEGEDLVVSAQAPETIIIKGEPSVLEEIDSIQTQPVDLSSVTENGTRQLELVLPRGTELSSRQKAPQISFQVDQVTEKTFTVNASRIQVEGLGEGLKALLPDQELTVTCRGSALQLQEITAENTELYIDGSNARQGQGEFTVGVRNTSPMKSASVSPQTITVTIQEEGE